MSEECDIDKFLAGDTPEVVTGESPSYKFELLTKHCKETIDSLPHIGPESYDQIRELLAEQSSFSETDSPSQLSSQIASVQIMKDRVLSLFSDANRNHLIRERLLDLLIDAHVAISNHKSADKRKGDAALLLGDFVIASAEAEAFFSYCKHVLENLESQHKTVSRRISCMEASMRIGEIATSQSLSDMKSCGDTVSQLMRRTGTNPKTTEW